MSPAARCGWRPCLTASPCPWAGVLAARDLATRDRRLATLTAALELDPVPVTQEVAGAGARLRVTLRDLGLRMAVNDSWIAAQRSPSGCRSSHRMRDT